MSNCPTCMNFVPESESSLGCYCNELKRVIKYDEKESIWYYETLGFRVKAGSTVIQNKNCVPFQVENREYFYERNEICLCPGWRNVCVEAYPSPN